MTKSSPPKELYLVIAFTLSETLSYHPSSPRTGDIQSKFIPEGQKREKKFAPSDIEKEKRGNKRDRQTEGPGLKDGEEKEEEEGKGVPAHDED